MARGGVTWVVLGGRGLRRGAAGRRGRSFEIRAGTGRPWGRVARGTFTSKVKSSEWSNFGGERLLGAANGDEPVHHAKANARTFPHQKNYHRLTIPGHTTH